MVLKVLRGEVFRIVHVETLPVGFHTVAGNAELGLLGTLHVSGHACCDAKGWKNAETYGGENLAWGPTVKDGRRRKTAANAMVSAINATRIPAEPVTTPPSQAVG